MKKNQTSTLKKVLRTLGYVLVLVASVFVITKTVATNNDLTLLKPFSGLADSIFDIIKFLNDYIVIMFGVGMLLIVFAIRSAFISIFMLAITLILIIYPNSELVNLFGVGVGTLSFIPDLLGDIISSNKFINPVFLVLAVVLINLMLKNKKPKKFSLFWYGLGTTILALNMILRFVNVESFISGIGLDFPVTNYLYLLSYSLLIVGSVFGVLGFKKA